MNRIIYRFAFLLSAFAGLSTAAYSSVTLVIGHTDGTATRVALFTGPKVQFSADSVSIVSPTASFRFEASAVTKCSYENVLSDVSSVVPSETVRTVGGLLVFDPSVKASSVHLFSADGKAFPVSLNQTGNGLTLPLSSLPAGIYLCKAGNQTFKICRP